MMLNLFPTRKAGLVSKAISAALAAICLTTASQAAETYLFDFGADATTTTGGVVPSGLHWNNVPASVGGDDFGVVAGLATTNEVPTDISLEMVARFNGANANGTTSFPQYPASATGDSLFGNTELFSGFENIFPIFRLSNLNPAATYTLTFWASRTGVSDNRETRYTVTGAAETFADLNVANNVSNSVTVASVAPDANAQIQIALTPGPNNNNANHFTYLGILRIAVSTGETLLLDFGSDGTQTIAGNEPPSPFWNNVTPAIGTTADGLLSGIVTTNGTPSNLGLQMTSRFNGVNTAGAQGSTLFPTTATQDSLFGNTEAFNNLSNLKPAFKLTGLVPDNVYSLAFYGSRTGASDNRETRYTVTGANSASADLNTSNNTNNLVTVENIRPTASGEITVELTAGPNNNNANHFTYLNVMRVTEDIFREPRILIDFGGRVTTAANDPAGNAWNNVTIAIASTNTGVLPNLVQINGAPTPVGLAMISRFNGVNENGTEFSDLWPLEATRDSLYGNTAIFNNLENITPQFKLTGLDPNRVYKLTLYASRMGAGDNRETRYTVIGQTTQVLDLNVANNEFESAVFENVRGDSNGEVRIELAPGPNNDNGNLFTYLGLMQIDWVNVPAAVRPTLSEPSYANGAFSFKVTGVAGKTYKIERSANLTTWTDSGASVTLTGTTGTVTIPQTDGRQFYRAVEQ